MHLRTAVCSFQYHTNESVCTLEGKIRPSDGLQRKPVDVKDVDVKDVDVLCVRSSTSSDTCDSVCMF